MSARATPLARSAYPELAKLDDLLAPDVDVVRRRAGRQLERHDRSWWARERAAATAKRQAATARPQAATAASAADAKAKAQYATRTAAVAALQRKLQREQGVVQASVISADGVYVVGKDIPAGTYHTTGGNHWYYATLGSTYTNNILDNNNFNGPETVDVSGAYAFNISGGLTWSKIG